MTEISVLYCTVKHNMGTKMLKQQPTVQPSRLGLGFPQALASLF